MFQALGTAPPRGIVTEGRDVGPARLRVESGQAPDAPEALLHTDPKMFKTNVRQAALPFVDGLQNTETAFCVDRLRNEVVSRSPICLSRAN
jgi:hypothetical protein